jgi:IclR family KDG regulon transcriptional repressor
MAAEITSLQILDRISLILDCFTPDESVQTFTGICTRTGLPKSTTHRLLTALETRGYLMPSADRSGYQLGHRLLHLGMIAQTATNLQTEARPIMVKLAEAIKESVILSVLDGDVGICLEMVECQQPVRLTMRPGQRLPLHVGASSKVLWSFLPEADILHILGSLVLTRYMPNTITDPQALLAELRVTGKRGYATSFEERDAGAMGIAAPVYNHQRRPVAGLGIAAPLARISPEQVPLYAPIVIDFARQLSVRLGAPQEMGGVFDSRTAAPLARMSVQHPS